MSEHPYPPTCRERQDAAIADLQVGVGYAQAADARLTRALEALTERVAALEATQANEVSRLRAEHAFGTRIPQPRMVAAMPLPSGAMMCEYATEAEPTPVYTPGYPQEEKKA